MQHCKEFKEDRSEAIAEMKKHVAELQTTPTEGNVKNATAGALHGAVGGLKQLSAVMRKSRLFLENGNNYCLGYFLTFTHYYYTLFCFVLVYPVYIPSNIQWIHKQFHLAPGVFSIGPSILFR